MDFQLIPDLLSRYAALTPKKVFIFFYDKRYTYSETYRAALKTAHTLKAKGIKKGDRVALLISNSPEYLFAYFGATSLGAIVVPVNTFLTTREVGVILNDAGASALITSESFASVVSPLKEQCPELKNIFSYGETSLNSVDITKYEGELTEIKAGLDTEEVIALIYTSGTTGVPKGVMLTHKNLLSNIESCQIRLSTTSKDRFVALLPLFHSYAFMATILLPIEKGASLILLATVNDVSKKQFKKQLVFLRPTVMLGVPPLYTAMSRMKVGFLTRLLFPFRLIVCGGASLPIETINRFFKNYGKPIVEGYGLSEASPVVSFNPAHKTKAGSIGWPLSGIEVKVVDEEDKELARGEIGELCARGGNVMKGYWNKPEDTAAALRGGWLHTGDVAYIDEEGFIFIVDRIKDMIIVKGINVYPTEIEQLIHTYKGVLETAVIGLPNKDGEEVVTAYIKTDHGIKFDEAHFKQFLKENLAGYKMPKNIVLTDNIPMTASGKVSKKTLREIALKGEIQ